MDLRRCQPWITLFRADGQVNDGRTIAGDLNTVCGMFSFGVFHILMIRDEKYFGQSVSRAGEAAAEPQR